ncbi:MAG TPA: filamentous hemagglutinin N-terminal domain-containing protein, partial [Opitutaceae bacterium]
MEANLSPFNGGRFFPIASLRSWLLRPLWSRKTMNGFGGVAGRLRGLFKRWSLKIVAVALLNSAALVDASPTGGQVVSGQGTITQSGSTTDINQSSQNLSLTWASFNIASQQTVDFLQPSSTAIAVNRIFDTNGTVILGHLNSNGQVYLINPNGIIFGQGAQIDVGGLVASTLNLDNGSLSGDLRTFNDSGPGSIVNQGTINAASGGYVAFLGNHVSNQGVITAQLGTVVLGAASDATLTFSGDTLVHIQVNKSVLNSLAENGGLIQVDGGRVIMTAGAKDALLASAVNNTGVIEAQTVEGHEGTIILLGGMTAGAVTVDGTLDASAPNGGNGGSIETSAAQVSIGNDAKATTAASAGQFGSWLIDPQDFVVAASGGDITGTALSDNLGTTSITLQSSNGGAVGSGNVNVNDAVSWSANTTLTLTASNNVNVNASITATGDLAGLVINPNSASGAETASGVGVFNLGTNASVTLSGANPSLSISGNAYTIINSLGAPGDSTTAPAAASLQGMAAAVNLNGYFALGSNIDATATQTWNGNAGFTPIGDLGSPYLGTFDGLGHTVSNLTINLPTTTNVGLFGAAGATSSILNLGMVGGSIIGASTVGGLAGSTTGSVSDSYTTGSVSGTSTVGGLMGSTTGPVSNSYTTGAVSGTSVVGGLMGSTTGTVSNCYASGNVTGTSSVGGLIGTSTGAVTNSYASGSVTATSSVGGLIGAATGAVTDSYASGSVTGTSSVGGLLGSSTGAVSNSYWNVTTSGQAFSADGTGLTAAEMQQQGSFDLWDFATTWVIYNGFTDPLLRSFMTPLTVTANDFTTTYNAAAYSGGNGVAYSVTPNGNLFGTVSYGGTSQGAISVGSYVISPGGLYSNQQGYVIGYGNGTLTVTPFALDLTG